MREVLTRCGAWWRRWVRVRWLAVLLLWGALPRLPMLPTQHDHPSAFSRQQPEDVPTINSIPPSLFAVATDGHVLSEKEQIKETEQQLPFLPLKYWFKHKNDNNKFYKKKNCAPLPSLYELEFHNTYWQTLHAGASGTFYLYGAYLDARNTSRIGPTVRILAVHDRIRPKLATHCQFWFEGYSAPVIVRNIEYRYMWYKEWGNYRDGIFQPYLLACVLPPEVRGQVPVSVSLVVHPCDRATNNLRVHYKLPEHNNPPSARKEFAVCVKGLDFLHEDLSVRLVEWIELISLLGADKIFFYQFQVHPNITKVLQYYERQDIVSVTPITLPGGQPNMPGLQHLYLQSKIYHKRQMEMIPYNDCLYNHMYEYRWLVLLDIDEVIVPLLDHDWSGLMKRALRLSTQPEGIPAPSSYHAMNIYYLNSLQQEHSLEEELPQYMHMLSHVYRTRNFTKQDYFVKSFFETDRVLTLHNHFPLSCLGGPCLSFPLPKEIARLQHYRADCVMDLKKKCTVLREQPVRDTALWRWRDQLVSSVETVLQTLGFLTPPPGQSTWAIILF